MTSDFGLADEYAGVMKGIILGRAPDARIVDLSHNIPPQDIRHAAYVIQAAYRYFPPGTLHVIVVDPGVGSSRRIVLLSAADQLFLAPDNGVLTLLLRDKSFQAAHAVTCDHLFLSPASHTFHGRDIFAPVAAHLATGMDIKEIGPALDREDLITFTFPEVRANPERGTLTGCVISVDCFGNLITNIRRQDLSILRAEPGNEVSITIKNTSIQGIRSSYASVPPGKCLALFGSRDCLEIACNQGNAAQRLHAAPDDEVTLAFPLEQ